MKYSHVFITGTDTNIGKTIFTGLLAKYLKENNKNIITQKLIQSGDNLKSEFAIDIETHINISKIDRLKYKNHINDICPYRLSLAASPHLAASQENVSIKKSVILNAFNRLSSHFDHVLVEGSGGLAVPINENLYISDLMKELNLPVILVVPNRLGTLNHTLLSLSYLKEKNIPIIGIILNELDDTNKLIKTDNKKVIENFCMVPIIKIKKNWDYSNKELQNLFNDFNLI